MITICVDQVSNSPAGNGRVAQLVEQVTFNHFFQLFSVLPKGHVISFATVRCGRFEALNYSLFCTVDFNLSP